jgi:uncharacterized Ntn-hydrolase superfamily protein
LNCSICVERIRALDPPLDWDDEERVVEALEAGHGVRYDTGKRRFYGDEATALADHLELSGALSLLKQRDSRIDELESINDAEREVHIREIESWERVHRAMIDERDAAKERVEELEAALDEVKVQSNTYAKRLVLLGYDDVKWYTTPFPSARDALAKETR